MHHKHLSHLMAKSMNELAHKSPLIKNIHRLEFGYTDNDLKINNGKGHLMR